jgi:hypothetical protein
MKIEQRLYRLETGWETRAGDLLGAQPQLVLTFGGRHTVEQNRGLDELRRLDPDAHVVTASTSGEITGTEVTERTITATSSAPTIGLDI